MLSLKSGFEIAKVKDKKDKSIDTIYIKDIDEDMHGEKHMVDYIVKKSEHIQVMPSSKHCAVAVYGPSGVGKSYFVSNFLTEYRKKFKNKAIYVFSPIKDEAGYIKNKAIYIKMDESIIADPLQVDEFENSICVFDDIEATNKVFYPIISNFRDRLLEIGRHNNIDIISIHHVIQGGVATRKIINESDMTVIFPRANFNSIEKLVKGYYGFTKPDVDYLRNLGKSSRWVCIKRSYPSVIISEKEIRIV